MKMKLNFLLVAVLLISNNSFASDKLSVFYDTPASRWMEALPIGNGRLGVMVFGDPCTETLALNEITFWKGAPNPQGNPKSNDSFKKVRDLILNDNYAEAHSLASSTMEGDMSSFGSHLSVGNLKIKFNHRDGKKIVDYRRELNLNDAIHTVTYEIDKTKYKQTSFCSNPNQVAVVRIEANRKKSISLDLILDSKLADTIYLDGDKIICRGKSDAKFGVDYSLVLGVKLDGGALTSKGDCYSVVGANAVELYYDCRTGYDNPNHYTSTIKNINSNLKRNYKSILKEHIADFNSLFSRVELNINNGLGVSTIATDKRLDAIKKGAKDEKLMALFFQYGRYLAISSSRDNSPLPGNLQGLWNDNIACNMPWTCDYHLDINIEQNYWLNDVANISECNAPLHKFISKISKSGRETAKSVYGIDKGWVANTMCNVWGYNAPGSIWWGLSPACGIWISLHLWQQYEFTQDINFLKEKVYPVLRDEANFYLDYLHYDKKSGYYLSGPSLSPENSFLVGDRAYCLSMMPTFERTLIYELFNVLIKSSELLNIEDSFSAQLKEIIQKLPPYKVGKYGQLQEWLQDYEENHVNHRHTSHMLGLYPYNHITPESTPELARACEVSIERKLAAPDWEDVEFSKANMIMFYSRLLNSEKAYTCLYTLFDEFVGNNLLTFSPPGIAGADEEIFIIDGNFAASAAIAEILIQSHKDYIEFLPALPQNWKSGNYKGLCVRGGGEVSLSWENGKIKEISLHAKIANNFNVKIPQGSWSVQYAGRKENIIGGKVVNYKIKKGETLKIMSNE